MLRIQAAGYPYSLKFRASLSRRSVARTPSSSLRCDWCLQLTFASLAGMLQAAGATTGCGCDGGRSGGSGGSGGGGGDGDDGDDGGGGGGGGGGVATEPATNKSTQPSYKLQACETCQPMVVAYTTPRSRRKPSSSEINKPVRTCKNSTLPDAIWGSGPTRTNLEPVACSN